MEFFQVTGDPRKPWINLDTIELILPTRAGYTIHLRDGLKVEVTMKADVDRLAELLEDFRARPETGGKTTVH